MKKNRKLKIILLLIITNLITLGISNVLLIKTENRVVVPVADYNKLTSVYEKYSKVDYVENIITNEYYKKPDTSKFIDGQLKGLVASLEDPYSAYLTQEEYKMMNEDTAGVFGGIGVIVSPGDDNLITVVSPIVGTPGEKAGIKPEDKIIRVNGEEFLGEEMSKAVKVMKGEPGTEVELTIMRKNSKGLNEFLDLKIKRELIKVESVKSDVIEDKIGYIAITSFDELTHKDFVKELNKLENENKVEGLIIDLRNNPGGLLDVCADIADELLGEADIVYTEDRHGKRQYLKSKKGHTELPLVVLVNEGSASASEILSGAIKDNNRGKIVGKQTFGKGLVQTIMKLPDNSGLKFTISEYYTPNGINIHGVGLEPDYVVELPEDIKGIGLDFMDKDTQLQKALEVLKEDMNK